MKPTVLILGATSDIARATARAYAAKGYSLVFAARKPEALESDMQDLRVRYSVEVESRAFDVLDDSGHARFIDGLGALPDIVVCAVGLLGTQSISDSNLIAAQEVMRSNYVSPALLLGEIANRMEKRGSGVIIGISSVAGDRGRASNYTYGSAKAGFAAFLSGLRNRLAKKGVHVITVKPGFVRTRMTEGMKLPGAITAEPEEVAAAIVKADEKRRNIIYIRPAWRLIMLIIQHIQ